MGASEVDQWRMGNDGVITNDDDGPRVVITDDGLRIVKTIDDGLVAITIVEYACLNTNVRALNSAMKKEGYVSSNRLIIIITSSTMILL